MIEESNMLITILIIGRNTCRELKELLGSIESQKISTEKNIDILYVDDASTDSSVNTFKSHSSRFSKKCIENSVNLGRSASRNRGIKNSKG